MIGGLGAINSTSGTQHNHHNGNGNGAQLQQSKQPPSAQCGNGQQFANANFATNFYMPPNIDEQQQQQQFTNSANNYLLYSAQQTSVKLFKKNKN